MKLFHISLLLLSAMLLNGCIGEDTDNCPSVITNNLTIGFRYFDDTGTDIFNQKIDKADLFVYDTQGRFVTSQRIDKTSLSAFAGAQLSLEAGTYRIVCWGNAADKSAFYNIEAGKTFADALISNATIDAHSVALNGDKLYYAPEPKATTAASVSSQGFTISVPEEGTKNETITFFRAHIRVIAYIKGFEDRSSQGAALTRVVELTGIPRGYDFALQPLPNTITYRAVSVMTTVNNEQMAMMDFNTPLFDENTNIQLRIKKQSDGSTVTVINLADFIRDNHITIGNSVDLVLPILIEYKQGSFEISLPGWGHKPIRPEL